MSLRAPSFLAPNRTTIQQKLCLTSHTQKPQRRRTRSTNLVRQSSNGADHADAEATNSPVAPPDPWLMPVGRSEAPPDSSSEASETPIAPATAASADPTLPPSPWDNATASSVAAAAAPGGAQQRSSGAHSSNTATGRYGYDPNDAAAAAAVAAAAAAAAATAAAAADAAGDGGRAAGPAATPAGPSSASGTAGATASAAATTTTTSSNSSSSSSDGSGGTGSGGGGTFNVREASAALSEDTAALLARLRAELVRTSSIKMPPRRTPGGSTARPATPGSTAASSPAPAGSTASSSSSSSSKTTSSTTSSSTGRSDAVNGGPGEGGSSGSSQGDRAAREGGGKAAPSSTPAATAATPDVEPPKPLSFAEGLRSNAEGLLGFLRRRDEGAAAAASGSDPAASSASGAAPATPSPSSPAIPAASQSRQLPPRPQPQPQPQQAASPSPSRTPSSGAPAPAAASAAAPQAAAPGPTTAGGTVSTRPSTSGFRSEAVVAAGSAPSSSPSGTGTVSTRGTTSSGGSSSSRAAGSSKRRRAVVVGGGIGGLVSAARLAKEGFSVTLLEANSMVGGRCQSVQRGRFRFDTGPSLLLFIETYRRTFAALGTSLAQQVPVVRVTPAAYRVFFQGAGSLDMLFDVQRMVEQLEGVEKGAGGQYLDWLATARAALELGMEGFIERDADNLADLLGGALKDGEMRSLLSSVGLVELLGTHYARMSRRFRDPRLRALFTFQDLYVGLSPYNAPGVYSLLAATELTDGVWYPLGGFGQIRDSLLRVGQSLGVRVRYGARVMGIRTAAGEAGGQRVTGVTLGSGEEVEADVVVSNRDVPLTYELLRGPAETHGSAQARRILAQDYSAGVIAYNWSLDKKLDPLLHHNVFLSGDFAGSWDRATSPETLARSPNFYVHCPSRTDPTAAPPGSDSVMVLLPVANIQEVLKAKAAERRLSGPLAALPGGLGAQVAAGLTGAAAAANGGGPGAAAAAAAAEAASVDYRGLVAAGREAVLRSMAEAGLTDVRQHIVDEMVIEPTQWRDRYSLAHGAAFGLSHGLSQLSVFRPGVADKQVRGLYMVGASTRPGNGVPLTMVSADLVTQRVVKDMAAGVI